MTPYEIVDEGGLLRLRRYAQEQPSRGAAPVLIVYSLIKRPYILDLLPDRSVVRSLLARGHTVYLTDWLPPGGQDASRGLADYVETDLGRAVECVKRLEDVDSVSLVGCCFGGLLAVAYAALEPENVRRIVPFALPFEMTLPLLPSAIDYVRRVYGNVPAWMIRAALSAWAPTRAQLPLYLAEDFGEPELALAGWGWMPPVLLAMQRWLGSDVPLAGHLFAEIARDAYLNGQFARSRLTIAGRRIDLGRITCPVLNVVAGRDGLVSPERTKAFIEHIGSRDVRNLVLPTGHLGLMASRKAHDSLWPAVGDWLGSR